MTAHLVEKLSPYLDGELSPGEAAEVRAHLRECSDCAERLAELAAVDELAQGLTVEAPGGYFESFPARLREKLPERAPAARRLPMWALAAAAVLLLAVITPLSLRERSLRPSVAEMPRALEPQTAPPAKARDQLRGLGYVEGSSPRGADADREARKTNAFRAAPSSPPGPAAGSAEEKALAKQAAPPPPAPPPETAPTATAGAPAQGPGTVGGRPAPALTRPRGPWFQSQSQGQSPGAFAPPPSDQAAAEARKDERATEDKSAAEGAPKPEKETPPAAELSGRTRGEPASGAGLAEGASAAPVRKGKAAVGFEALRARRAQSAAEARALREAWRQFAADNPSDPRADEARVAVIEAGALAFKLGHDRDDRARAETDAQAYLARPDAVQADRVRALLSSLAR